MDTISMPLSMPVPAAEDVVNAFMDPAYDVRFFFR